MKMVQELRYAERQQIEIGISSSLRLRPPTLPRHRHLLPHPIKQLKHRQSQPIGDDLDRIDGRIGLPSLYPAQVRLIEAAPLPEHHLALASL